MEYKQALQRSRSVDTVESEHVYDSIDDYSGVMVEYDSDSDSEWDDVSVGYGNIGVRMTLFLLSSRQLI